jgi:hypothetical protein
MCLRLKKAAQAGSTLGVFRSESREDGLVFDALTFMQRLETTKAVALVSISRVERFLQPDLPPPKSLLS